MAPPRRSRRLALKRVGVGDLPTNVLTHILTTATAHDDLLAHVALCARVHPEWRRAVMGSAAYGLGIVDLFLGAGEPEMPAHRVSNAIEQLNYVRAALQQLKAAGELPAHRAAKVAQLEEQADTLERSCVAQQQEQRSRVLQQLSSALREAKVDRELDFPMSMGDAGARALEAAVRALPSPMALIKLNMSFSRVTHVGMKLVVELLRDGLLGRQLKSLFMTDNDIGDAGAEALAAVLPPTLEVLFSSKIGCGDAGMFAIARAIPATRVERLLWRSEPAVTAAGWTALGAALPTTGSVGLAVSADFGGAGMARLAENLQESSVKVILVDGCSLGDAGARAFAATVRQTDRSQLMVLRVDNDSTVGPEGRAALEAAAAQKEGFILQLPEELAHD